MYETTIKKSWWDDDTKDYQSIRNNIDLKEFFKQKEMIVNVEYGEDENKPKIRKVEYKITDYLIINRLTYNHLYEWLDVHFINQVEFFNIIIEEVKKYYNCLLAAQGFEKLSNEDTYILYLNILDDNTKELIKEERVLKAIGNAIFEDDIKNYNIELKFEDEDNYSMYNASIIFKKIFTIIK